MSAHALEVAAAAVLDALACRPTAKNEETARRVAQAVLSAVGLDEIASALRTATLHLEDGGALELVRAALARAEGRAGA